jgi:hypothetical protein
MRGLKARRQECLGYEEGFLTPTKSVKVRNDPAWLGLRRGKRATGYARNDAWLAVCMRATGSGGLMR